MRKSMFLMWGDELATTLRDGAVHARLAAVGVRRLQVNVTDDPVAGALRIDHVDDPIAGFVSVWDADAAAVAEVLGQVGVVHGYAVDEHRRLDPPEAWDGSRADALANVAVLRRPAELDHDEWLRRWMVDHTTVAIRTQATFGYVQNVVVAPLTAGAPAVDGLVEELFPSAAVTDMHAFYGSRGDDAELGRRIGELMASVARIGADRDLDLVPTSRHLYEL
ncbi:EthD domain-containing protein [Nocardioides sp. YIM 152315]|uniref:EthD domain-containing protein n=1 Tax=Nocardioides sp. YIM 152315 TaxID=3031760 RepID=UPI0023DA91BE|nr:EthD domain-containing protein [Nocardioides sp. YIM 152315]MDF1604050.1 EthD domain-containing protein [Nocardioides sp. YIM 152315]